ncbi:MAG: hypothetical protein FRX48_03775 [Lasallia pustulata]|uniref:Uncharacterized protein n=1 Tax=Lasallia pustulata TaxID=136370 RepID=A0A5M8PVR3_9LECA|nr:MAG: hypothetical protein FRX48_03775 [Lasallia pustulata]
MATNEEADKPAEMDAAIDPPHHASVVRKKSSFAEALNKFATNTFSRRRTVANIATSNPAVSRSRLPTASGIARSTSFFSNLNGFGSKTKASKSTLVSSNSLASFPTSYVSKVENQQPSSRPGKASTRIAQTPSFARQASVPVTPQHNYPPRESSVQIIQHQLMAPLGPPVPRRKPFGELQGDLTSATSSPHTPSYARTTSSHENRRRATLEGFRENQISTPTHIGKKTPTSTSSGKPRSGTPYPKHTPALTSSGKSRLPVRAASEASETPTSTPADIPEPMSTVKARVSFSEDDQILVPIAAGPLEPQVEPEFGPPKPQEGSEFEESETPTPTPSSSFGQEIAALRQNLQAAKLASVAENLEPAKAAAEEEVAEEEVAEEEESRAAIPVPQNPRHIFTAMPSGYWAGRLMALSDRFRTEEMHDSSSFHRVGSMHNDERRTRRVFVHLNSLCQTDQAKASLAAFREAYMARMREDGGWEGGKGKAKVVVGDEDDEEEGEEMVEVQVKKMGGLLGSWRRRGGRRVWGGDGACARGV